MERVKLGTTDLMVSKVCIGCWQFNNGEQSADKTWPGQPIEVSQSIFDKALECGINYFDTAKAYLNSEVVMGKLIQGRRQDIVLASKLGHPSIPSFTAEDVDKGITSSLQDLQTTYIDLYQVHWPHFIGEHLQECVDELKRQQARGRIRHIGVCNYGPQNIKDIIAAGLKPVTNQLSYSLLWRPIEYEVMPMCVENDISILCYSPLQQGLLSGKYLKVDDVPEGRRRTRLFNANSTELCKHGQEGAEDLMFKAIRDVKKVCEDADLAMAPTALSWCLQQPAVQSVIAGAANPEQVQKNSNIIKIPQTTLDSLDAATKQLRDHFGNTPDLWAPQSRIK